MTPRFERLWWAAHPAMLWITLLVVVADSLPETVLYTFFLVVNVVLGVQFYRSSAGWDLP